MVDVDESDPQLVDLHMIDRDMKDSELNARRVIDRGIVSAPEPAVE
jgi:hypothetical protein